MNTHNLRFLWRPVETYPVIIIIYSNTHFISSAEIVLLFQILYLTEPDTWSAAAMYQATRIFASNLNAKMAQR